MRVKLGPYKVPVAFWQRLQQLPGSSDEQRVMMALDFACEQIEALTRRRAEADAKMARMVDEMRPLSVREAFEAGPQIPIPPKGFGIEQSVDEHKLPGLIVTDIDREAGAITLGTETP